MTRTKKTISSPPSGTPGLDDLDRAPTALGLTGPLYKPTEVSKIAKLSKTKIYADMDSSAIACIRVGGARLFQPGFEAWLRQRFRAGVRYDELVRELLTVPIAPAGKDAEPVLRDPERPNPLAFYAVKEARPENLAAAVTRSFLGVRLECARGYRTMKG
jgi:hypothetical protein